MFLSLDSPLLKLTQFFTVTNLSGNVAFLASATKYLGIGSSKVSSGRRNHKLPNYGAGAIDAFHFTYDLRLDLDTSFRGKGLFEN